MYLFSKLKAKPVNLWFIYHFGRRPVLPAAWSWLFLAEFSGSRCRSGQVFLISPAGKRAARWQEPQNQLKIHTKRGSWFQARSHQNPVQGPCKGKSTTLNQYPQCVHCLLQTAPWRKKCSKGGKLTFCCSFCCLSLFIGSFIYGDLSH